MKIHELGWKPFPKLTTVYYGELLFLNLSFYFFFSHQSTVYRNEKVIIKGNNLVIIKI